VREIQAPGGDGEAPDVGATPEELARLSPPFLLRWIYITRMTVAGGMFLGAVLIWEQAAPFNTLIVTVVLVLGLLTTGWGLLQGQENLSPPDRNFLYVQMAFDTLLVTALVHVTGGAGSVFAALYIPVIAMAAILIPFPGVALIGALAAMLYLAEAVWGHGMDAFSGAIILQLALFGVVALLTGILGDRVRRAGAALGMVQSELQRLRLDTSDILATVSSGILTVDEGERLIYMNPAGEALLGVDARQWTGAPVLERVGEVAPELTQLFRRSLARGVPVQRATAMAHRDGERLTLGVTTTVREVADEPRAVTGIFQDITDSQRLAVVDRQKQRLEAVTELAASMAHEIKNPLASIRSAVEQFTSERITDQDRTVLSGMVVRESDRLSRLLSDFIDFSRVRMGRRERVELARLVEDAVAVARQHPDAEAKGVEVAVHRSSGGLSLVADPDILHRAVLNLLLNAVQFSPDGEAVDVHLDGPGVDGPDVGIPHPCRLRIRDQGPGVPEDELSRIFDPFFTTRPGGTGLGLAMVHRAVEAHGGAILVENREGGGAEFALYLPSAESGQGGSTPERPTAPNAQAEVENV
jgi:two-component system, NtrC family, sensor histidine kinase PilS